MFGPYEIVHEGCRYFGNVTLREIHIFEYDAATYVVDVERLTARSIPPEVAAVISGPAMNFGGLVPETSMKILRGLGLVASKQSAAPQAGQGEKSGADTGRTGYPVTHVGLLVAQECNMRCVYCYGNAGKYAGGGLMDESTAIGAVDWLLENSGDARELGISFFGGEPLLNFPLVRKIVPYARKNAVERGKAMSFSMTTNGSLLTDEIIAFIREEDIHPLISFDGPPEVQNSQRPFRDGSGSYDTVTANARKLLKVLPRVPARATLHGNADPARIRQGMKQAGFTVCQMAPSSPVLLNVPDSAAAADEVGEHMATRLRDLHRQEIEELLLAVRERKVEKDSPLPALGALYGLATGQKRYYGCGIGKVMAAIAVNGDIYPCHRFVGLAKMRLGNIADYRAGTFNNYHRAVVDNLPECRACWARYFCGGGCFYHNKAMTGDMRRPDGPGCREKKAMIEHLVHVHCQLGQADRQYIRDMLEGFNPEHRQP